jgi:hypothetical protein
MIIDNITIVIAAIIAEYKEVFVTFHRSLLVSLRNISIPKYKQKNSAKKFPNILTTAHP